MSKQSIYPKYKINQTEVDAITIDEAAKYMVDLALKPKSPPRYVIKQYVELLEAAGRDPQARKLFNQAELALPEGVSAQWAAAYLYESSGGLWNAFKLAASIVLQPKNIRKPIKEKFSGTVFTWRLLELCSEKKVSVYLVGSPKHSSIDSTATFIKHRLPNLKISGTWPGQLEGSGGSEVLSALKKYPVEQKLVADINQKQPGIILVGMGVPLQEELIVKMIPQLKHGVLVGEGGTFDYDSFGGRLRKAPKLIQGIGLEWLWRLALEPKRWRRQLALPRFMWTIYRQGKKPAKN